VAAVAAVFPGVPAKARAWLAAETEPRTIPSWLLSPTVIEAITREQFHELLQGADPESMQTLGGEPLGRLKTEVALGSPFGKSLFTPLPPCRVIDTRVVGGKLAAGETRQYVLRGETTNYSAYGGAQGGCGIPDPLPCNPSVPTFTWNRAAALALGVTAIDPEGAGSLELWAANHPEPAGSRLSYAAQPPAPDLANEVIAAMCDQVAFLSCGFCTTGDVAISATGAASHVVVDVVGFFTGLDRFELQARPYSDVTTAVLNLASSCKSYGGLSLCVSSPTAGTLFAEADLDCRIEHVQGTTDLISFTLGTALDDCAGDSESDWLLPSVLPSATYDTQVHVMREFPLPAGQLLCIRSNGRMPLGASAGDRCFGGRMRGVFYPDPN
jgi:hypothetical protein